MHELSLIATQAQEIAEAISSVLNVYVDVVDYRLIRIAAVGCYSNRLGRPMRWGTISRHVLQTRELYCVTSPADDPVCKKCPGYTGQNDCLHQACISAPILFDEEAIGTINLISYTKDQVLFIQENESALKPFLTKMSEIIVTELKKEEATRQNERLVSEMSTMLNAVTSGIILTDGEGKIVSINPAALQILRLGPDASLIGSGVAGLFPGFTHNMLMLRQKRRKFRVNASQSLTSAELAADISPIYHEDLYLGAVITFDRLSGYLPLANAMLSQQRGITFDSIIGEGRSIVETKELALRFAQGSSSVLILGESGTGKELFARAIHNASPRRGEPFVTINCGALPESLIESELFGYVKGAFTGASSGGKIGMFEMANHGTIFLDEIGTMPIYLQAKLLRVLQEHEITRIGAVRPVPIDVRVIAATNADLLEMSENGLFRRDLFYRIAVLPLKIPPLRERREDIILLTEYFIQKFCTLLQKPLMGYTAGFVDKLLAYSWPGNVRELQNVIEYAVNILPCGKQDLDPSCFPAGLEQKNRPQEDVPLPRKDDRLRSIHMLLERYGDSTQSKRRIAKELGIGLSTLYRILQEERRTARLDRSERAECQ